MGTNWEPDPVEAILRRRGHQNIKVGNPGQLLLPIDRTLPITDEQYQNFFDFFSKSSLRKVSRHLTAAKGTAVPVSELSRIAGGGIEAYLDFLESLAILVHEGDHVCLTRLVDNIGPTLEWYVAELCEREFAGSAAWSVQLEELPVGGDYDVLAWLPPALLYVEVKSCRPSEIDRRELARFLQRNQEVAPDLAVFLIDTDDAVDEVAQRLCSVIDGTNEVEPFWENTLPRLPDFESLRYHHEQEFYLTNSKPSIRSQLSRCLRHHARRAKWPGSLRRNFISGNDEEW